MPPSPKLKTLIKGRCGKYRLEELISQGNMAWCLRAVDVEHADAPVFLKYYMSPTPKVSWFGAYVKYVEEINRRLMESQAAQYCVLCKDLFMANPRPGLCHDKYLYQAFDYIEGGSDLRTLMDKGDLPWPARKAIALVFLVSMGNIHAARVVHCDLKPENIQMVPDASPGLGLMPRMIDMDRSILEDRTAPWREGESREGYTGTPGYMSPEHFNGKVPCTASDVFTVGMILSELLAGVRPFGRFTTQEEYRDAILAGDKFERVKLLGDLGGGKEKTARFAALIESCFNPDPAARPSCRELFARMLELSRPDPPAGKKGSLRLSGDLGSRVFRLDTDVGKGMLASVSSQTRFCAASQFRVECQEGVWYVIPIPTAPNLTALNGEPVSGRASLSEGDCLCLLGRSSLKQAMQLKVSFA